MSRVVERLAAEHRDLQRLVALLDRQHAPAIDAGAPGIGLLVDALTYLTRFPDVTHHPIEDRMAERLRQRGALDAEIGREIEAQHARLAGLGLDLLRDLEGALRRESISGELVATNIRLYAERLRHNMAFEELTLFPAALSRLGPDDWRAIAPSPSAPPDPLFHPQVEQRFAELHRAIADEAACGCEDGDA